MSNGSEIHLNLSTFLSYIDDRLRRLQVQVDLYRLSLGTSGYFGGVAVRVLEKRWSSNHTVFGTRQLQTGGRPFAD